MQNESLVVASDPSLESKLFGVSVKLDELIKEVAKAIAEDKRFYMSTKDIEIPSMASSVMFNLLRARSEISRIQPSASE